MPKRPALLRLHAAEIAELPSSLRDTLVDEKNAEVLEILNRLLIGEILTTTYYRKFYTCEQQRYCKIDKDFLYFRHRLVKCNNGLKTGKQKEKKVDLRHVHIRLGTQENEIKKSAKTKSTNYFSIVFDNSSRLPLSFIAQSEESAKEWVLALNHLKKKIINLHPRLQFELSAWERFNSSKLNRKSCATWKEAKKSLLKHGFDVPKEMHEEIKRKRQALCFDEFFSIFKSLSLYEENKFIFNQISSDNCCLTLNELLQFKQEKQLEKDITVEDCEDLIEAFELCEESRNNKQMTECGFNLYMMSSCCELFDKRHDEVYQDMNQPLSHYYIASSHNTYSIGNQLTEPSSVDAYMNALLKGCKCVELDCWDGPDEEPVIYHGNTLMSKIKFRDVIEVISKYAFEISDFPVILSIENHCSLNQQEKMVTYLKSILGNELLSQPLCPVDSISQLPSPNDLKGKIILKAKTSTYEIEPREETVSEEIIHEDVTDSFLPNANATKTPNLQKSLRQKKSSSASLFSQSSSSSIETPNCDVSPELSKLIVYCKSVKFTTFDTTNKSVTEMSSFSEGKAKRMAKHNLTEVIEYHKWNLSRTYPHGTRVDSSNYDPVPLWNAGFQIVALNYQTMSDEMDFYNGKFRQNGGCGYVLKPDFLRLPDKSTNAISSSKEIRIYFLSTHKNGDDEYDVEIYVNGDREDNCKRITTCKGKLDISTSRDADFYHVLRRPELAMFRFVLIDNKIIKETIGQYTLPFTSISQGYRHIPFLDCSGVKIPSLSVLVYVAISQITNE